MCEKEQRGWEKSRGTSIVEAAVSDEGAAGLRMDLALSGAPGMLHNSLA